MPGYSHTPIIHRTGVAADLAGTTAIKNEMLWTTDTKTLYVEQGGEKIVIGGNYSNPLTLLVGTAGVPLMAVESQSYNSMNGINTGTATAILYMSDKGAESWSSALYIPVETIDSNVKTGIQIEIESGTVGQTTGISISNFGAAEDIYIAMMAAGFGIEVASWSATDSFATCGYLASMQAEIELSKEPHADSTAFNALWCGETVPTYGVFCATDVCGKAFMIWKTDDALDATVQIYLIDHDFARTRFEVFNDGDIRISSRPAVSGDGNNIGIDSPTFTFRSAWWNSLYSIDNTLGIYLESTGEYPTTNATALVIDTPASGGDGYASWPCTKIYASVDAQVALGDADNRFTDLYLSGNVFIGGDAAATSIQLIDGGTDCSVGDGKAYFPVPARLNGLNLTGINQYCITPGITGTMDLQINRRRTTAAIGSSDTQFDITNPSGTTFRYTFDGTGTDPSIADSDASLRIGDVLNIQAQNFAAGNKGRFALTGVGANYVEVDNASGAVESNKTIGTGSIVPTKFRDMLSTVSTLDSEEYDTSTAATAAVINTSYDDLLTHDVLRFDLDAVHTTAAKGLAITLAFG
jgi:hypothetical protein